MYRFSRHTQDCTRGIISLVRPIVYLASIGDIKELTQSATSPWGSSRPDVFLTFLLDAGVHWIVLRQANRVALRVEVVKLHIATTQSLPDISCKQTGNIYLNIQL